MTDPTTAAISQRWRQQGSKGLSHPEHPGTTAHRPGTKLEEEARFMGKTIAAKRPAIFSGIAFFALLVMTMMAATLYVGAAPAEAAVASVSWTAPTDNTGISGYKLHIGNSSRSYDQHINVGNTTSYSTSNLTDGSTYYFAVTAYNSSGLESAYSNEISRSSTTLPPTYVITATAGSGGKITALNNSKVSTATNSTTTITSVTVSDGASQSFSIAAATGYRIADLKVDGASVGAVTSYTFSNVKANHSITATFAINTNYTISASAGSGGSITPTGTSTLAANASQSYTITPATGYKIAGVVVDGTAVGAVSSYSFSNITANHTIAASFAVKTYTVTSSAGVGGTITPAGTATVSSGSTKTYTIAPSTGYKIADVKVDGVSVSAVSTYTFSNITASHTIAASFVAIAGNVVFATNSGGSSFTDSTGVVYKADTAYSGGSINTVTASIAGTVDDVLYQKYRYGNFSYNVALPNGPYSVVLKFADNMYLGTRVFDVKMEGVTVLSNFDIFAKAGNNNAYDVTIPVNVADGALNLSFISKIGSAKINGIVIKTR